MFEKKSLIIDSEQKLLYPDKFCILNENIYSIINQLLNINIGSLEEIKFELYFNHGRFALKSKIISKFNNQDYILICSLFNNVSRKDINYFPEIILSLDNFQGVYNSFDEMIKNENIYESCSKNKLNFESKYNCKSYLISKNNNFTELNKNEILELNINNYNKVNKYLSYLIIIYNEYSKIKEKFNETYIRQLNKPEEEYYLINRNYMNELENKLHFKEFIN